MCNGQREIFNEQLAVINFYDPHSVITTILFS